MCYDVLDCVLKTAFDLFWIELEVLVDFLDKVNRETHSYCVDNTGDF